MKKIMFIAAANSVHTVKWVNSLSVFFEIHLVYCSNHEQIENKINKNVVLHKLEFSSPFGYYLNAYQLKKIYKKVKPDLVNAHYASGYGTLVRMSKIPCDLMSIWGSDIYEFPDKSKFNYRTLEKNLKYAKNIGSTSQIMANVCKEKYPHLDKKFFIIPFGVDINKFKKDITIEKDKDKIDLIIVKSLEKKYGIEYAIEAMKYLVSKNNKYFLHIYGDGIEKENLENLIDAYNLKDKIKMYGRVKNDELPKILSKSDIFCATSVFESFGVSIVEAMAAEIPVVVSDADGFVEVTNNGETGIVVPKKDALKLSEEIDKLYNDKDKMKYFSKKGRERVEKCYDFEKNVMAMKNIYEEIIGGNF